MNHFVKSIFPTYATLLCGIALLLGLLFSTVHQESISIFFYILAFVCGGALPLIETIEALFKEHRLTVDVLMITAAIGSMTIGYWHEGALLIFIFSLAETLEERASKKSSQALSALLALTPDTAHLIDEMHTKEVATKTLKIGDRIRVLKGELVPIDGELISEQALLNQASITGESIPVLKSTGDSVIGGTLNAAEAFDLLVTVENNNTMFAKITKLVAQAQETPSKTSSFIAKLEKHYVNAVFIIVPLFILTAPFVSSLTWSESFYRGMILLTVLSPCALIASATPAILSTISRAAKSGLILKGGAVADLASQIDAIVFDKTGTLTVGKPAIVSEWLQYPEQKEDVYNALYAIEATSTHPLSQAILDYIQPTSYVEVSQLVDLTGKGLSASVQGRQWKVGSPAFILETSNPLSDLAATQLQQFTASGQTVILVSKNNEVVACFGLEDQLKEDSKRAIQQLKNLGIYTVLLTGDHPATALHVAHQLEIDEWHAECLPIDKVTQLQKLQTRFKTVAMVGDGINDAPALATSQVSFAMGSGTDIAMETADIVLIKDDILLLPFMIQLSKKMRRITLQNILFSLCVIALLVLANILQVLNLPLGVIGHEGSTLLVIFNSLRLLKMSID